MVFLLHLGSVEAIFIKDPHSVFVPLKEIKRVLFKKRKKKWHVCLSKEPLYSGKNKYNGVDFNFWLSKEPLYLHWFSAQSPVHFKLEMMQGAVALDSRMERCTEIKVWK